VTEIVSIAGEGHAVSLVIWILGFILASYFSFCAYTSQVVSSSQSFVWNFWMALLYQSMMTWVWRISGMGIGMAKLKCADDDLPRSHIVHLTSHKDCPGVEPGPPQWETSDNH
jgi:hypothetical protein